MFLAFKIIGCLCTVAIPTGICGTQAFLSKKHQTDQKKKIEAEFTSIQTNLNTAHTNYQEQIQRIKNEKNALAETKSTLTYVPVVIASQIEKLKTAKSNYQNHHSTLQTEITAAINKHNAALTTAQTTIENLWKAEKARVEALQTALDTSITNARNDNKKLIDNIDNLKSEIDKTINDIFNPPSSGP